MLGVEQYFIGKKMQRNVNGYFLYVLWGLDGINGVAAEAVHLDKTGSICSSKVIKDAVQKA